ncbi:MAG: S8 family serine peptidase [Bacteroidetes bacterium]|nr:S8 family serine peptidase [Bacteroidota bacterium]
MKKIYLIYFLIISISGVSQTKYWVQFHDKNNSPYSLSTPSQYLSARAIARRTTQGIAIDSTDLPVNPTYVAGVAATGAAVHTTSKWFNGCVVFISNPSQLTAIAALPYVVSNTAVGARVANTNDKFSEETFSPLPQNTQRTGEISSSSLNYGPSFNQINMLGGVCLHNAGFRGQGMQIAIIDAGFYNANNLPVFDTLFLNNRILGTWDFVTGEANVYDDHQHGSEVLSTMGGNIPGQLVGTAPDASFWLLRSEEAATEYVVEEYYWATAAEYADSVGADVINSSLGYTEFDDATENHTYADMNGHTTPCARAANFAARKGIAVVVAAGNSGQSPWFYIGTPADADSALAVAATDASGVVTGFSSRGPSSDGDVKPNVGAQGGNSVICDPFGTGTMTGNGTSFASPIMCGLVTCLLQAHPALGNMQLLQEIEMSASQYSMPDSLLGYGIPDFCAANLYLSGNPKDLGTENIVYDITPNPFSTSISFSFFALGDQKLTVRLFDMQGKLIVDEQVSAYGNSENHYKMEQLNDLAKGVYSLQIYSADYYFSTKLVKE